MPKGMTTGWISVLLMAMGLAVFGGVAHHDFVSYDDDIYVTANPHVQEGLTSAAFKWAFTSTTALHWHPLTWLSHMLDWQCFGADPRGHHLHSLLLHILNSILLFAFFRRATGAMWPSAMIAALFAVHPLQVEPVAWVSARKDVLAMFFWLLTLTAYGAYARAPGKGRYLLALGAFVMALMSKPITATLPLVLLLLDFWPLQRLASHREGQTAPNRIQQPTNTDRGYAGAVRLFAEKIPFFFVALLSGVVTLNSIRVDKTVDMLTLSPSVYDLSEALINTVQYLGKTFWPMDLTIHYPFLRDIAWWQITGSALFLGGVTWFALRQARRDPYFLVGWLWYLLTLLPVLGIISYGPQRMADRYMYIPLVGIAMVVVWGFPRVLQAWRHGAWVCPMAAGAVLIVLMFCARFQTGYWENDVMLYERAVKINQNNYLAHNNLGIALARTGSVEAALTHYKKALAIKPDYDRGRNNIGIAYAQKGAWNQALFHFEWALSINPDNAQTHYNLGFALEQLGDLERAIHHYRIALRIDPQCEPARANLAAAQKRRFAGEPRPRATPP